MAANGKPTKVVIPREEPVIHTAHIEVGDTITFTKKEGKRFPFDTGIVAEICVGCNGVVLQGDPEHYSFKSIALYVKKDRRNYLEKERVFNLLRGLGDTVFLNQKGNEGMVPGFTIRDQVIKFLTDSGLVDEYFSFLRKP